MTKCKRWEVWWAYVKYEDSNEIKKRPVLIIGEEYGLVLSLKMTTHKPRNATDYLLKHWKTAGLDRETTVRTDKFCKLRDSELIRKVGRLTSYDMVQIQSMVA